MALLFHQNMENYAGDFSRNRGWMRAFGAIQRQTGKLYWAAGFSELLGNSNARFMSWFPTMMNTVAKSLDDGLESTLIIAIGEAASGRRREFVGIAWDHTAGLTVEYAGQVLLNSSNKWIVHNQAVNGPTPVLSSIAMPPRSAGWKPDARGVGYIAGKKGAKRYIIGFTHNEFGYGNRSGAFAGMTDVAENLQSEIGGVSARYANATVIIGGDFNVVPPPPRDDDSDDEDQPRKRLRSVGNINIYAAKDDRGRYINTTSSSPYDFWLSNQEFNNATPRVYTDTRGHNLSKHAAITFNL